MAEVTVSGVFKRFGPVAALQEIDLTVHDNEFVVLGGAVGQRQVHPCFRIIAGLERQSEGSVCHRWQATWRASRPRTVTWRWSSRATPSIRT